MSHEFGLTLLPFQCFGKLLGHIVVQFFHTQVIFERWRLKDINDIEHDQRFFGLGWNTVAGLFPSPVCFSKDWPAKHDFVVHTHLKSFFVTSCRWTQKLC